MATGLAACIGLPPTKVDLGLASMTAEKPSGTHTTTAAFQARAAIHPLQLAREYMTRRVDVGAGYLVDTTGPFVEGDERPTIVHGPLVELGAVPLIWGPHWTRRTPRRKDGAPEEAPRDIAESLGRVTATAQGRLLLEGPEPYVGWGMAFQTSVELASSGSDAFASSDSNSIAVGVMGGERAIGLYTELAYGSVAGLDRWTITGGLQLRLPSIMMLVIPLNW